MSNPGNLANFGDFKIQQLKGSRVSEAVYDIELIAGVDGEESPYSNPGSIEHTPAALELHWNLTPVDLNSKYTDTERANFTGIQYDNANVFAAIKITGGIGEMPSQRYKGGIIIRNSTFPPADAVANQEEHDALYIDQLLFQRSAGNISFVLKHIGGASNQYVISTNPSTIVTHSGDRILLIRVKKLPSGSPAGTITVPPVNLSAHYGNTVGFMILEQNVVLDATKVYHKKGRIQINL